MRVSCKIRNKNGWKRWAALAVSAALVFPAPMASAAETDMTVIDESRAVDADGFEIEDGVLKKYTGTATEVVIPDGVESIGDKAFGFCRGVVSITIPESVTSIGNYAFCLCSGLTSVTIPESVTSIGNYAFHGCGELINITIPERVESIGDYTFNCCSKLRNIAIPEGVTSIGEYAFGSCSGLTSITVPENITRIEDSVFEGCSGLTSIAIPERVTSIGKTAFKGCSRLTSVTIPEGVMGIGDSAFEECSRLASITIPESVTSIGKTAFKGCSRLTSITIPEGVTSIGETTFKGCSRLTSITIPESVTSIGNSAFSGCGGLTSITIPEGVANMGRSAFYNCGELTSITIPERVTRIEAGTFWDCSGLTSVVIPEGVTSIGGSAFEGCSGLKNITIPENVTSIGEDAFRDCSKLGNIIIPKGVESIGESAFSGCSALTAIEVKGGNAVYDSRNNCNAIIEKGSNILILGCKNTIIPGSVTSIGKGAFRDNSGLRSITIPESVTSIGESAFSGCSGLTSVTISESVTSIGYNAFEVCRGLASITIPERVESIGYRIFKDCSGLKSITILGNVKSIEVGAFSGCKGLTSITIPESVTNIDAYAFDGSGLTSVRIPASVTSIGNCAFKDCSGLTAIKVEEGNTVYDSRDNCNAVIEKESNTLILGCKNTVIPENVISIKDFAFSGSSGLASVVIPEGVTSIEDFTFFGCSGLTSITIPESVTSIGQAAFSGCSGLKDITIPESVRSIWSAAFSGCSGLTSISIPKSLTCIRESVFANCSGLTSISIPKSVTSIWSSAFTNCSGLTSIKVEEGNAVFDSRNNCNAVIEKENNTLILGCENTIIPEGVTNIEESAFEGCSGLAGIIIPDSVTSIGYSAFEGCSGLTSITLPESVTNIGWYAFRECSGLTSITIPERVESIGDRTFEGCSGLASITIPESVTSIWYNAFEGCSKELTIHGMTGSYAQTYAIDNNIKFSADKMPQPVEKKMISSTDISIEQITYTYDGTEKRPTVTVKDGLTTLASGIDYSLKYSNNTNAGTATVTIAGLGNYIGTTSKTFTISAKSIDGVTVTLEKTIYTYDGTAKQPSVTVKDGSTSLKNGTDYTVSYSNNVNVGTATVTVTGKGNYTGTATKTFTINARADNEKSFEWGKSNWRFDNSGRYFSNYNVNNDVKIKMKNDFNLSNSEIKELEWRIAENNESGFMGSCFGMTVSEIMAYQGGLKLSRYGGSDIVNQNANTSNMTSVINFIQVLQSNSEMCQSIRQTPFLSGEFPQAEFIKKLSDVVENSNYLVKLSYKIVTKNTNSGSMSKGYHAVLVYGIEKCNYYSTVTGKTYDRKILIADPNYLSGNVINNDACLYFKSSDCSWIVPYWNKTYSGGRVQSCYWNAESGETTNNGGIRNIMRYESLKEEVDLMSEFSAGHYIAGLEIDNKSQNVSAVEKVKNSGNPNADYTGDFADEIVRYDMDMDDNIYMTEDDELYALWNPTSSYTLSYLKPSDYNLKMDYETVDYYADVTNSTYTLFKPNGAITLKGSDADYNITMVTEDTDCVTDWYSVTVSGADVDNLVYTKVKNGYTLSASNLRNVKVSAEGEDFTADATISTNYDDVFIYEIDKNTIGVKVDADKNGTYETQIPTEETHQYGSEWRTDDKSHWKECVCGEKSELSAHKFKWVIDKNASIHESGFKHEECVVCGYRRNENTVIGKLDNTPAKGQTLTDRKSGAVYKIVIPKTKGGTVEYTKPLNNNTANISIPSTVKIDGISYKVTSIAANAFKNNKKITKVKIGSNVTTIGKNAFNGCSKLKTLIIGNNVVSIGDNAFLNCTSLKTVTIPAKVKKIGKQAFCGCKKLKTIKVSTKKLVSKNVGSKAFAKIDPKATVKVPASCLKSYKKLFQKKGINGKKQKIKK